MQNLPSGIFCKNIPYYIEKGECGVFNKSATNKNERGKPWQIIWAFVIAITLVICGLLIASYMVLVEKVSIESASTVANIIIFISTFVALLTQTNRGGKLLKSGLYVVGLMMAILLVDMLCFDGVTSALWQRLCSMMVSATLFVIITSRKGKRQFHRRGYAG